MEDLTLPERFIEYCESLPFPIVILKPDRTAISANSVFFRKYRLKKKNVTNRKCHQVFFHSDDPCPESECPLNILLSEKKPVSKIKKTLRSDGSDFYGDLIYSPLLNDDGKVDYIVATIKDITQSRLMEADLKKTKEFLEGIIESSVNAIVVADMKGVILLMNESARRLFGYPDKVDVGKSIAEYHYTPGGARSVMKKLRSPDYGGEGKLHTTEMKVINSSGEEIPVEMTASIIYEDGKEVASMAIFQDLRPKIEEEKKLGETRMQLVQSDKLASIGRLAA
ncbi:MAG: PAS domain S-box protein, partial [Proteobacteria bacterium]|nr:PAS domain S-box protein [Pseudomonadota bacterium]